MQCDERLSVRINRKAFHCPRDTFHLVCQRPRVQKPTKRDRFICKIDVETGFLGLRSCSVQIPIVESIVWWRREWLFEQLQNLLIRLLTHLLGEECASWREETVFLGKRKRPVSIHDQVKRAIFKRHLGVIRHLDHLDTQRFELSLRSRHIGFIPLRRARPTAILGRIEQLPHLLSPTRVHIQH